MNVKINIRNFRNNGEATLNIPINMGYQLVDQADIIETKFVKKEIENEINEIIDYEKVRLIPAIINNQLLQPVFNVTYNVYFLNQSNQYNPTSFYSEIGFNNADIKFRKKAFTRSFLRLSFYDSDIQTSQRLLSFLTIYPDLNRLFNSNLNGTTPANMLPTSFTVGNSLVDSRESGEGFFIYHFKDEVLENLPKELFMRGDFSNARTGVTTRLMSTNVPNNTIDTLIKSTAGTTTPNNIYTKYILIKNNNGYYYEVDQNYSTNVSVLNDNYIINLYQISAI
jgi:hypothetical protein